MDDDGITHRADLRGFRCPLPALKTRARLKAMSIGERLEVLTDDPLAGIDIPAFAREAGQTLTIKETRSGDERRFVLERCEGL